jgi:hypothetical protein
MGNENRTGRLRPAGIPARSDSAKKAALRCPACIKLSPAERQKLFIANIVKNVRHWQAAKRIFYGNDKPQVPYFLQ